MTITIAIHYVINGNKNMQQGTFKTDYRAYQEDANKEAARIAKDFTNRIRKQFNVAITIEKVIYNDEHDITDLVK